jgi:hypothetical protein
MVRATNKHSSHDRFAYATQMEPEPASFDRFGEKNENRVSFTKFLEKMFRRCPVPTIRNGAYRTLVDVANCSSDLEKTKFERRIFQELTSKN